MSDASSPRSPSAAPTTEGGRHSDSICGDAEFDTPVDQAKDNILMHTGMNCEEEKSDSKAKRKRTSPQDQALLESEYRQNTKPNKAARADIVQRVSLNEKEVQIWFQNRRQIDRRKLRPLLQHEIAAFGITGNGHLSSDSASMPSCCSSQVIAQQCSGSLSEPTSSQDDSQITPRRDIKAITPTKSPVNLAAPGAAELPGPPPSDLSTAPKQESSAISRPELTTPHANKANVLKSFSSTPGYLSNRWKSMPGLFSSPSSPQCFPDAIYPPSIANPPFSCPERTSTMSSPTVRLSMSLDGKAELVATSPSPSIAKTKRAGSSGCEFPLRRMRALQRSQQPSVAHSPKIAIDQNNTVVIPRLPTGRSRDARTWESCCDGEARDELTLQAENESHGSAVAAISLIRSASHSVLKPNSKKRNAPITRSDSSKQSKKVKLGRSTSSPSRLQSLCNVFQKPDCQRTGFGTDDPTLSPSGDSDKENWLPHENRSNPHRRPLPSSRVNKEPGSRPVLGDNYTILSHASDLGNLKARSRRAANAVLQVLEDQEKARTGEDADKLMRGELSPSKQGDFGAIQGLLSLSQGNWR